MAGPLPALQEVLDPGLCQWEPISSQSVGVAYKHEVLTIAAGNALNFSLISMLLNFRSLTYSFALGFLDL